MAMIQTTVREAAQHGKQLPRGAALLGLFLIYCPWAAGTPPVGSAGPLPVLLDQDGGVIPPPKDAALSLPPSEMRHLTALAVAAAAADTPQPQPSGRFLYRVFAAERADAGGILVCLSCFDASENAAFIGGETAYLQVETELRPDASQHITGLWLGRGAGGLRRFALREDGRVEYHDPRQLQADAQAALAGLRELWNRVRPEDLEAEALARAARWLAREEALRELAAAERETLPALIKQRLYFAERRAREAQDEALLREILARGARAR